MGKNNFHAIVASFLKKSFPWRKVRCDKIRLVGILRQDNSPPLQKSSSRNLKEVEKL